ncbi:MAG: MFS transporter [Deltaproteobacteria bacterium]|jgi:fucose permease|nr:MFS transporter [Deltaproteobacteria bacterium]
MFKFDRKILILALLYLSFVSLGLPDTLLGTAWPQMRHSFGRPLEFAGLLLSLTTIFSVISSLGSGFALRKLGAGLLIAVCALATGLSMFGYALAAGWSALIGFALVFGLGQGAVDTAVNAYMARNYSARHMNWVHCCWGVGAAGGPLILGLVFTQDLSWRYGYACVGGIQLALALLFFLSLPLWQKVERGAEAGASMVSPVLPTSDPVNKAGKAKRDLGKSRLLAACVCGTAFYFLYPGVELMAGLWGASYLSVKFAASPASAALSITLYWGALTIGRFLAGIFANRVRNRELIRGGLALAFGGALLICFAASLSTASLALVLLGLGLAPLYPTMMHDTPARVGLQASDRLTGLQVGAALAGAASIPALAGFVLERIFTAPTGAVTSGLVQAFGPLLLVFTILLLLAHELSLRFSLYNRRNCDNDR